jgi:flagellar biosynthesis protein FlhG
LASFDFDQAEGLRRMLAGPKPRVFTFLSATSDDEKSAMLVNLGASLGKGGNQVALVDARAGSRGVAARLDGPRHGTHATLLDVARQERALEDAVRPLPQGFGLATLARECWSGGSAGSGAALNKPQLRRLANIFGLLANQVDILLVDGELDAEDAFPIPAMANGEIVVQVSTSAASIKTAYSIVKRLNAQLGRRPFGILVTGATEQEAQVVYNNMARASNRYLAVQLNSFGSIPADEHVKRAARLGRSVVDAFPLAGASVAFRRLAGQVVASDMTSGLRNMMSAGANMVI